MLDNKLVVLSSSPDYSDSPRALSDYILSNTDYDCFWVIRDAATYNDLSSQGIPCALQGSSEANTKISSARFLVSDSFEFSLVKRWNQIYVSTWHGFGPKVIGFFDSAATSRDDFRDLTVATTQCDLFVVPSSMARMCDCACFAMDPRKAVITGYPRTDYLFSENGRQNIDSLFGKRAPSDCARLIFYLPTMRKGLKDEGVPFEENLFNYSDYDPDTIDRFLEDNNSYIVAKFHFADNSLLDIHESVLPKRVLPITTEDLLQKRITIYHLLNAFDVLITDYSSVYSDFLLLDKPVIFSLPDYDQFQKERGFIADDPRFMMPGAFVETQKQLIQELDNIFQGQDTYRQYRQFMKPFFQTYQDGNSSKRLFEAMLQAAEDGIQDCHKDYAYLYVEKDSPLAQYTGKCVGEFFFDHGDGFNEEDKQSIEYDIHELDELGFVDLSFSLHVDNLKAVRFDPDRTNRIIVQDFSFIVNGQSYAPTYTNGIEVNGGFVFKGSDPQFALTFSEVGTLNTYYSIHIRFMPIDVLFEGSDLLAEAQIKNLQLRNKLDNMRRSNSWRLTKLFRAIGKMFKIH